MLIEICRRIVAQLKLGVIQTIDQTFEEAHHRFGIVQIIAVPSIVTWPIGRLRVLNHVNPALIEQRKQKLKRLDHMAVDVASVVNDNIQRADAFDYSSEEFLVCLATPQNHDPIFFESGFILDINSKDRCVGEVIFPES